MATSVGFSLDHDQYTTVRHLSHNFGQPPLHLQDQQIGCVLSVPCIPRPPRGLDDSARTCNECSKAFSFVSARVCASRNFTIAAPAPHTLSVDAPTGCSLPSLQHLCQACGRTCCLLCVINHVFDESTGTAKRLCAQCLDAATLLSERSLASEAAADGTDGVTYDYERQSLAGTSLFVVNLAEVTLDLNVAADARLARITGTAVRYVETAV